MPFGALWIPPHRGEARAHENAVAVAVVEGRPAERGAGIVNSSHFGAVRLRRRAAAPRGPPDLAGLGPRGEPAPLAGR